VKYSRKFLKRYEIALVEDLGTYYKVNGLSYNTLDFIPTENESYVNLSYNAYKFIDEAIRKDKIIRKTQDHSIARLMADVEDIDKNLISKHKDRNTLYNYFGKEKTIKPEISGKIKLMNDDVILLGSAGMWENLEEKDNQLLTNNSLSLLQEDWNCNINYIQNKFNKKIEDFDNIILEGFRNPYEFFKFLDQNTHVIILNKINLDYKDDFEKEAIVIDLTMEDLERRLRGRKTDDEATIQLRLKNSIKELEYEKMYDTSIVNYTVDDSCGHLIRIIEEKSIED
jgi:hypothetical protein